jgi:hypothetical protein
VQVPPNAVYPPTVLSCPSILHPHYHPLRHSLPLSKRPCLNRARSWLNGWPGRNDIFIIHLFLFLFGVVLEQSQVSFFVLGGWLAGGCFPLCCARYSRNLNTITVGDRFKKMGLLLSTHPRSCNQREMRGRGRSGFFQFEPPRPTVDLSRRHLTNGYAVIHLPAIADQSEPGSPLAQYCCALMTRGPRGVWHTGMAVGTDVSGVFVSGDRLEERTVDLLDHVPCSRGTVAVRMGHEFGCLIREGRRGYL